MKKMSLNKISSRDLQNKIRKPVPPKSFSFKSKKKYTRNNNNIQPE